MNQKHKNTKIFDTRNKSNTEKKIKNNLRPRRTSKVNQATWIRN